MNINGICPYETPCGWCSKWDKKCDKKIPERGLRVKINPVDEATNLPTTFKCSNCVNRDYDMPQCTECLENSFKHFQARGNINA
jgi:hypothetical protein